MTSLEDRLAEALRALFDQCVYMGAPADHEDMMAAAAALTEYDQRRRDERA